MEQSQKHFMRLKTRITCAYSPAERAAIEWLNRTPEQSNLPAELAHLQRQPRRTIAKSLSAEQLAKLVSIHAMKIERP